MNDKPTEQHARETLREGVKLGDFTLLRKLGEGGQAVVFLARQESLDRTVALKVLLSGFFGSDPRREQLRREAKAATRVRHPGIATVHGIDEAGGWHFLIQEHIEGRSLAELIVEWRGLTSKTADHYRTVADWVAQVAEAIQAAHDIGVIHRDIKPHNVLIDEHGNPKVIDFGHALGDDSVSISEGSDLAGTPAYMSPDQVLRELADIDHRTDIFSLGVVLYEMLITEQPFKGDSARQTLQRVVLHDPPPPQKVIHAVPRELSIICGKAMEKRRQDRYQTMKAFAADLRAFLSHRPITAQPPGMVRRSIKWMRRHPAPAAACIVGVLGMAGIVYFWMDAVSERNRVTQSNVELLSAIDLIEGAYQYLDPRADRGIANIFDGTAQHAIAEGAPGARVRLLTILGEIYGKWGLFAKEKFVAGHAVEIAEASFGLEDERTFRAQLSLAHGFHQSGLQIQQGLADLEQAETILQLVLSTAERVLGRLHVITLDARCALGQLYWDMDDPDRAELHLRASYEGYRRSPEYGPDTWDATAAGHILGKFLRSQGRLDEAEDLILEAVQFAQSVTEQGPTDYRTNFRIGALGKLRLDQNRLGEAEDLYRESLQGFRDTLGDDHPETITAIRNLGLLLGRAAKPLDEHDRYDESTVLLREAYERSTARGDDPAELLRALLSLANMLRQKGDFDSALPRFVELREMSVDDQTTKYWVEAHYGAGRCLQALERSEEALPYAEEAVIAAQGMVVPGKAAILVRCQRLLNELNQ